MSSRFDIECFTDCLADRRNCSGFVLFQGNGGDIYWSLHDLRGVRNGAVVRILYLRFDVIFETAPK